MSLKRDVLKDEVVLSFHDLRLYQRVTNDVRYSDWCGPARRLNISDMWFIPERSKTIKSPTFVELLLLLSSARKVRQIEIIDDKLSSKRVCNSLVILL
jgi:hypothetical protein